MNQNNKKRMNHIWILHQKNIDGFAAAAIVAASIYSEEMKSRIHIIPIENECDVMDCFADVRTLDDVILLGYPLDDESDLFAIDRLYDKVGDSISFTIIDHHKNSLDKLDSSKYIMNYLRKSRGIYPSENFGHSTCMLVYVLTKLDILLPYDGRAFPGDSKEYFMPFSINYAFQNYYFKHREDNIEISRIKEAFDEMCKDAPELIKYIEKFTLKYNEKDEYPCTGYSEMIGAYCNGIARTFTDLNNENSVLNLFIQRNKCYPKPGKLVSSSHPIFHKNDPFDKLQGELCSKGCEFNDRVKMIQNNENIKWGK